MENLPVEYHPEPEVIEPEILGYEPKPSWWKRLAARAALSLIMGAIGAGLCLVGAVFTVSIIGAAIGIPMILIGLFMIAVAAYLFFGGGNMKIISFHNR